MTTEHIDDDKLQRFYDGELTEGEAAVISRAIEADATEGARVAQMRRLGEILRSAGEIEADTIDSEALFVRIERGIEAEPNPRFRVIEGAKRRQRTGAVVGMAMAVAAAIALAFLMRQPTPPVAQYPGDDSREMLAEVEDLPHVNIHPPAGSSVERVEFGANTGTVFEVEGDQGQPLAVVWIAEE